MEYWDLYDKNRNKLNKTVKRGDKLLDNEYHLVVDVWIKNSKGEYLISQRSKNKTYPLMWECTGGSVLSGEKSIDAAIRETEEELGIKLNKFNAEFIGSTVRYYKNCPDILDVWLFENNTSIKDIVYQNEEVNDAKWFTKEEILKLNDEGKFQKDAFFEEVLSE